MGFGNRLQSNFARGEISPDMQSRNDLDVFSSSLRMCRNFLPKFQGGLSFAPGLTYLDDAQVASGAVLIPFVYRDTQAYQLELYVDGSADLNIRVHKDDGTVLYSASETGWVINDASGTSDSELIGFLEGVGDDPGYTTNGGTPGNEVILTVTGTFTAASLQNIKFAQTGSALIIISEGAFLIQIWRGNSNETAWAVNKASVLAANYKTITSISDNGGFAQFTVTAHGYTMGHSVHIKNSSSDNDYDGLATIKSVATNTFTINKKYIGNTSTTDDAVTKAGAFHEFSFMFEDVTDFLTATADIPKEVKFNEGRLFFTKDDKKYGSMPVTEGTDAYCNFIMHNPALATDAVEFTCSISSDKIDLFKWLKVSNTKFYAGMENLIAIIHGTDGTDTPIAGDSIRMSSIEDKGCADVAAIEDGQDIIYVGGTGKTINAFKYDLISDSKRSDPITILVEHFFANTTIKKIVFQRGTPDIVWVLTNNGKLFGAIYNSKENITGWFKYSDAKGHLFSDISVLPVSEGIDRVWVLVARPDSTGSDFDRIEQIELESHFYRFKDFYTGDKTEDTRLWKNAVYEQQKYSAHMHSMVYHDAFTTTESNDHYLHISSDKTTAYVSSDGTTANTITGTSSPLYDEVGENIVLKADTDGYGEGVYEIVSYDSGTGIATITEEVGLADVDYSTPQTSYVVQPGSWCVTFSRITSSSLQRYYDSTGADIDVLLDGGYVDNQVIVKDGSNYYVDFGTLKGTVVYFGYKYTGIVGVLPLDVGGRLGSAFVKLKNINTVRLDVKDSVNVKYGDDLYDLSSYNIRDANALTNRPAPPFTGVVELPEVNGDWENRKHFYIVQDVPVPLNIRSIDIEGESVDE